MAKESKLQLMFHNWMFETMNIGLHFYETNKSFKETKNKSNK